MNRSRIRPVSKRRAAQNRVRARLRLEMVGKPCEAQLEGCAYTGTDWHERLSRARGGSPIDVENRVWLCRPCHSWVTEHPREATELGLLVSAYGGRE